MPAPCDGHSGEGLGFSYEVLALTHPAHTGYDPTPLERPNIMNAMHQINPAHHAQARPTIGYPAPQVEPYPGVADRLLRDAREQEDISIAEYVLSLHHETIRRHHDGLPMGRTDYRNLFEFYWSKAHEIGNAALFLDLPLKRVEGRAFLTLHTDRSALIWIDQGSGQMAPVPYPLLLDLGPDPEALPFVQPATGLLRHSRATVQSLSSFVARNCVKGHNAYEVMWVGEINLIDALAHEAQTWIDWATSMPQVVLPDHQSRQSVGPGIIFPWCYGIRPLTSDDQAFLGQVLRDIGIVIARSFGAPLARTMYLHLEGRPLHRDGTIGDITFFIDSDELLDITQDQATAWTNYVYALFDHPNFPLPKEAQICQNWRIRDTRSDDAIKMHEVSTLYDLEIRMKDPLSAHEQFAATVRLEKFGVPLPVDV
jgi:hypothetical protein